MNEQEQELEVAKAAADRKAALTAEVTTDDPEAAKRHARAQSPRGRTDRPNNTAG
jgi:hypothetical protein